MELKLYELLSDVDYQCLQGDLNLQIDEIAYASAKACENSVFVCIKGMAQNGHDYAPEAIEAGAVAVVCSERITVPKGVTLIRVKDTRKALAHMSAAFFGKPAERLITIGVTGTKGKTTTTFMIKGILEEAGYKAGLIGTVKTDTGTRVIESEQTTPESYLIQQYLREMADAGCRAAVIEVSSQALMLSRVEGIRFDYGVFTNIDEDHIGPKEHKNFAEYAYWKSMLFQNCRLGFVNGDDPNLQLILKDHVCKVQTYGFSAGCNFRGSDFFPVKMTGKLGVEFAIKGVYNIDLVVGIPGRFSAYNAMAAAAVCSHLNIGSEKIAAALMKIAVPGRQEMIPAGIDKVVMIDYAHNGTALRSLLGALREYRPKKLTCVFGCGGERDRQRRYKMGEAAAALADFTVITADNPRNEPTEAIINDIIIGTERNNGTYTVIPDRREAIAFAVSQCIQGEIVVIAGKGHETYQIIGNEKLHFDDREEVLAAIEKVKDEHTYNR